MPHMKHLNLGQKKWVQINDDSRGTYNTNCQITFKISMLKSSFCDYSDAYILVSGAITLVKAGAHDAEKPEIEIIKKQYLKLCTV